MAKTVLANLETRTHEDLLETRTILLRELPKLKVAQGKAWVRWYEATGAAKRVAQREYMGAIQATIEVRNAIQRVNRAMVFTTA